MNDTYIYELDGNLYINLTNKCSNACTFCVRNGHDGYYGHKLWLKKEPTAKEVLSLIDYTKKYGQVVFCGFGEPTEKIEVLLEIGRELKAKGYIVRLNTNGHGNLINCRDITKDLSTAIDYVNVSLNAQNATEYQKVCRSIYGEKAFEELIDFAKKCQQNGIKTNLSIVDCIGEKAVQECKELAQKHGLCLRVRELITDN